MGIGKGNLLWRVYQGIQGKEKTRTRAYALGLALGLLFISLNGCLIQDYDHKTYEYDMDKSVQIVFIKCCTDWKEKLECRVIGECYNENNDYLYIR